MQINESLQIVIPLREDSDGNTIVQGYHIPISREVFEANYRILAATKAEIASKGLYYQMDGGPRIAALALKDEGRKDAIASGLVDEVGDPQQNGALSLLAEIKRLTTILAATEKGWEMIPVDTAIAQGIIDADDWREGEAALVFFTCHYAMVKKSQRKIAAEAICTVLKGLTTSLKVTELANSLPMLTAKDVIKVASSVPS